MKAIKPKLTPKQRKVILKDAKAKLASYPYCYAYLDRHEKLRVYLRRRGHPDVPIRDPLNSVHFKVTYDALIAGKTPDQVTVVSKVRLTPPPAVPEVRTLGWLIDKYTGSNEWNDNLKKATQNPRRGILEAIKAAPCPDANNLPFGDMPLTKFTMKWVKHLRDSRIQRDKSKTIIGGRESGNGWLKALRAVFKWAVNDSQLEIYDNPTLGLALIQSNSDGHHCWTGEEIAAFRAKYPLGKRERLAFEVLYATGQRIGDAVGLGWSLLESGLMKIEQEKGRKNKKPSVAYVPVFDDLKQVFAASERVMGGDTFLVSAYGTPWVKESFGNWFNKVVRDAGLVDCTAHGLRKAFVVNMIYERRRPSEIMATTGHKTQKEFDRYAREFLRKQAAWQLYKDLSREDGFEVEDDLPQAA